MPKLSVDELKCIDKTRLFKDVRITMSNSIDYPILTVSQLSQAIKYCLEKAFPFVWLQGEISNFTQHSSGHLYFSIKDAQAQISAVMFRPDASLLKLLPKNGSLALVKGEINVYPLSGKYQIVVRELRPVGIGELLLKLEELKIHLHKKGWFSAERKKSIPKFPKRIGVVTSPTGAAIQDILNILTRRFSGFHLILNPVKVQGEGAAQEIAQAIEQFNRHNIADVIIVGRGGGSIEDLWAFNEEIVAEAIFNSRIPIISAVGHETDHCIADYVADVRAPTPSAAAELVIAEKVHVLHHLSQLKRHLEHAASHLFRHARQRLNGAMRHPLLHTPFAILGPWIQQLDSFRQNFDKKIKYQMAMQRLILQVKQQTLFSLKPENKLKEYRNRLQSFRKEIDFVQKKKLQLISLKLNFIADSLDAVNPKKLLTKGYCILFSEKRNSAITSVHAVEKEERVKILLTDGSLSGTITDIISK